MPEELYPTFDIPEDAEVQEQEDTYYPSSVFFDFSTDDFATGPKGKMSMRSEEYTSLMQWCMKVVKTQKGACIAYNLNFGIDYESILSETDSVLLNERIELEITEALLSDPYGRVESVGDFDFERISDGLQVSFVVNSSQGVIPLQIII